MKELSGGGYSLDLVVGLMAWLFFADAISTSTYSLTSNPHLVKKVVFPIILLPIAHVGVSFLVHTSVVVIICVVFAFFGTLDFSSLYMLLFWMVVFWGFTTALAILISGFAVILKDIAEVVPAIMQILFWASPIIWPLSSISPNWQGVLLSNPLAIVLQGYRSSILTSNFGVSTLSVVVLVVGTFALLAFATLVFERMKIIFAEEI